MSMQQPDSDRHGNFAAAIAGETHSWIQAVLSAQRNYYELWGSWPTATQIAEQLGMGVHDDAKIHLGDGLHSALLRHGH
jgi:hypothetical protein